MRGGALEAGEVFGHRANWTDWERIRTELIRQLIVEGRYGSLWSNVPSIVGHLDDFPFRFLTRGWEPKLDGEWLNCSDPALHNLNRDFYLCVSARSMV